MSAPRSVRFESDTLTRLSSFAARHPGLTSSSAVALLVEEGLRMDAHPGVVFREGPTGRRAGLASGPDVWEVVRAVRDTRAAEPDLTADEVLALVGENTGLAEPPIKIAVDYFAAFPVEINVAIEDADRAEAEAAQAREHVRALLDT